MRIALDAMGSDRAPAVEVAGAIGALHSLEVGFQLVFVGDREKIEQELLRFPDAPRDRIEIVHAPQRIEMNESPVAAVRRKRDSSIAVGLDLHAKREVDAFISAGSTGAVLAGSLMILGALPGVERPSVGAIMPSSKGHILLVDAGANVDTRPSHLLQFAHLGATYAADIMGVPSPRVGLLSVGAEPEKGDERTIQAHQLLTSSGLNFVGNIEGRDIIGHRCDVLVSDGFAGNVLLKFYESVAGFFLQLLEEAAAKANASIDLQSLYRVLDYAEYGGAPLLGVDGVVIICHGGSPPYAISNAIRVATQSIEHDLVSRIRNRVNSIRAPGGVS
ncbi:MAG: phosphate acyltransferase PlsX [Gemmatimonadota bacterium]|jgi:glycerol-3-phosphate acyltransferase PlsX|nr:phosphate acyltransferase PlsX [Gemmatimonadota bacterium]